MRPPRKKGDGILLDTERSSERSRKAARKQHAGNVVMVEGRLYSVAQIAARLGIDKAAASKRLKAAQAQDGPVTWAKLEGK